jgi:hypothetical protein
MVVDDDDAVADLGHAAIIGAASVRPHTAVARS